MQQSEHADEGFMWVDIRVLAGPASEELALLVEGQGPAAESVVLLGFQTCGRVDEDQARTVREAEELAQHGQSPVPGFRRGGQERHYVVHVDDGPVVLAALHA